MKIRFTIIACLWLAASTAFGLDLPQAPAGYAWQECPEIGGALLKPNAWHFSQQSEKDQVAYFITKEPWQAPQPIDVGLTFNVLFNVPKKADKAPTEFAKQYVAATQQAHPGARTWSNAMGSFQSEGVSYPGIGDNAGYMFFNLVIANDKTGTAYLVVFEAPESTWSKEWAIIEPTVKKLLIDDEY